MKLRKILLLFSVIILFVGGLVLFTSAHRFLNVSNIYYFLEHPAFGNLGISAYQTRNSLMKMSNLIHFPYWFRQGGIPEFHLSIREEDLAIMESALPVKKFSGYFLSPNKKFVKGFFKSDDYASEVEVRYRGAHPAHWNAAQRSLLIKFPEDSLFQGMKSIDLIIPEDREYFLEALNIERASRAGLAARGVFFSRLNINGKDAGVYFITERFSNKWLERNGMPETSEVFSQSDDSTPFDSGPLRGWRKDIHEEDTDYDALEVLLSSPAAASQIVDLEKWYAAMSISVLANSTHALDRNLNWLFNNATGKFEPLMEDIGFDSDDPVLSADIYKTFDIIISPYILSTPTLYQEYRKFLQDMASEENLEKDLAYYDNLTEILVPEFYKDQTKLRGNFYFATYIKEARERIVKNYNIAREIAAQEETFTQSGSVPAYNQSQALASLPGSFKYLPDTTRPIKGDIIWSGVNTFRDNVIIPKNTKLIIKPGAKIYLDRGVSIISYSPIEALGTKNNPILIARINPDKNWGSVAIINADKKSEFDYVTMIGGSSSEKINGVVFTGMLAAHNAPLYVRNSNFYYDGDDDAINVKYATGEITNSKFFDMNQDAIDLDFTENFVVSGNVFSNIGKSAGGDAIDLSFGNNAVIARNKINICSDKGVSVGEKSRSEIYENTIKNCLMGIAVKDESYAVIHDNVFSGNSQDISLYIKKQIFGEPNAEIFNNVYNN